MLSSIAFLNPKTTDAQKIKNIDIPPKSPFNPPKGGFSSFAPRYSSSKLDSTLSLASVGKGGLVAKQVLLRVTLIKPVPWLRSTANAVKNPTSTSSIFALICRSIKDTQFWRQSGVDTPLGKKSRRWIVLKRTAIAGIFLLAEIGAPLSRQNHLTRSKG